MMTPYEMNKRLLKVYGKDPVTGQPKYRVVRSDEQIEKRTGSYKVFTDGGIYLRDETGTREIRKYWYITHPCWMLERVEANTDRFNLINEKFTYEPLLPFLDKDNKPIALQWSIAEFLINRLKTAEEKVIKPISDSEWMQMQEKKEAEMYEKDMAVLDAPDSTHPLPTFKTSSILRDVVISEKLGNYTVVDSRRVR